MPPPLKQHRCWTHGCWMRVVEYYYFSNDCYFFSDAICMPHHKIQNKNNNWVQDIYYICYGVRKKSMIWFMQHCIDWERGRESKREIRERDFRVLTVLSCIVSQSHQSVSTKYIFIVFAYVALSSTWSVTSICVKCHISKVTVDMSKSACY